jgi:hypothetical protein
MCAVVHYGTTYFYTLLLHEDHICITPHLHFSILFSIGVGLMQLLNKTVSTYFHFY